MAERFEKFRPWVGRTGLLIRLAAASYFFFLPGQSSRSRNLRTKRMANRRRRRRSSEWKTQQQAESKRERKRTQLLEAVDFPSFSIYTIIYMFHSFPCSLHWTLAYCCYCCYCCCWWPTNCG